jgi:tetratricopeptide (TPR) repeat protein
MSGQVSAAVNLYQKGLQIIEDCNDVGEDYTTVEIVRSDFATLLDELERCDSMQNCVHTKKVPVPHWIYICFHGCIASYIKLMQTITDIRLSLDIRNEEAQELWHANIQVKEKLLGSNDPQLAVHLQSLAASYAASEKYDKCVPLLQRSLDLLLADLGPNAPELCFPLDGLATALLHLGRPSEAEPLARQALRICEAAHGSNSIATGMSSVSLCGFISLSLLGFDIVVGSKWVLDVHVLASLPVFSCHDDQFAVIPTFQLDVKESFLSS